MSEEMTIGQRIADSRIALGISLEQAAHRAGIKPSTLRKWESGATDPRANRLQMLAGTLNVPLVWLISGRKDLDPLDNIPSSYEVIEGKLEAIKQLHGEMQKAVAELEDEISKMRQRSDSLDQYAEEALPE